MHLKLFPQPRVRLRPQGLRVIRISGSPFSFLSVGMAAHTKRQLFLACMVSHLQQNIKFHIGMMTESGEELKLVGG